jgi:hypothetical protein
MQGVDAWDRRVKVLEFRARKLLAQMTWTHPLDWASAKDMWRCDLYREWERCQSELMALRGLP